MLSSIDKPHFSHEMAVRDYELDRYGVINNAVYQNYLEHTRHLFLESHGVIFVDLFECGYSPVITKAELEYRSSLKSRDEFVVNLQLAVLSKVKFVFLQEILSLPEKKLIISAKITGTILDSSGRPCFPDSFQELRSFLTHNIKSVQ
ncbi:MAG: acyl-CoA thioesterase [SAR324 cluster bacterium]|nr:acyl-CoA thioesterase [SAR324 cluster bacterium]MBL7034258.1 acyl-CoA thioesterase [SAR324 cluster bacterium]